MEQLAAWYFLFGVRHPYFIACCLSSSSEPLSLGGRRLYHVQAHANTKFYPRITQTFRSFIYTLQRIATHIHRYLLAVRISDTSQQHLKMVSSKLMLLGAAALGTSFFIQTEATIVCNTTTTVTQPSADFIFLVDSSGSMCPYIDQLMSQMGAFTKSLAAASVDARFAVMKFGGSPVLLQPLLRTQPTPRRLLRT